MLREKIGEPATLELLAEECAELAHAVLKLARIERGESPSPLEKEECIARVMEEMVDVRLCMNEIISADWFDTDEMVDVETQKYCRMVKRLGG